MHSVRPEQESFQELPLIAETPAELARNTILVVEDEDFVREVTCEVLLSAGYLVLRARTAAEALHLFTRNGGKLQLLLTDVVLPGRSGQMLAQGTQDNSPGAQDHLHLLAIRKPTSASKACRSLGRSICQSPFRANVIRSRRGRIRTR